MKIITLILALFASIHAHASEWKFLGTGSGWKYSIVLPVDADARGAASLTQLVDPKGQAHRRIQFLTAEQCQDGYGYTTLADLNGKNPERGFEFVLGGHTIADNMATHLCNGWATAVKRASKGS